MTTHLRLAYSRCEAERVITAADAAVEAFNEWYYAAWRFGCAWYGIDLDRHTKRAE